MNQGGRVVGVRKVRVSRTGSVLLLWVGTRLRASVPVTPTQYAGLAAVIIGARHRSRFHTTGTNPRAQRVFIAFRWFCLYAA